MFTSPFLSPCNCAWVSGAKFIDYRLSVAFTKPNITWAGLEPKCLAKGDLGRSKKSSVHDKGIGNVNSRSMEFMTYSCGKAFFSVRNKWAS